MTDETKSIILLIIGIGSFMFAALVVALSPFIFGYEISPNNSLVSYSDGKLTILHCNCYPNDPQLVQLMEFLIMKNYTLNSVSNDHVYGTWVFMTR